MGSLEKIPSFRDQLAPYDALSTLGLGKTSTNVGFPVPWSTYHRATLLANGPDVSQTEPPEDLVWLATCGHIPYFLRVCNAPILPQNSPCPVPNLSPNPTVYGSQRSQLISSTSWDGQKIGVSSCFLRFLFKYSSFYRLVTR